MITKYPSFSLEMVIFLVSIWTEINTATLVFLSCALYVFYPFVPSTLRTSVPCTSVLFSLYVFLNLKFIAYSQ